MVTTIQEVGFNAEIVTFQQKNSHFSPVKNVLHSFSFQQLGKITDDI